MASTRNSMLGWAACLCAGILACPLPAHAQNADQAPELSASEAQKGGYVFDRGSRFVEDKRLKISIIPLFETFRSQAPLNVGVRLQWAGPGLLEGRMLVDLYANERYVGSWKSPDLAVNDQVLSFPMILPPSPLYDERDPYNLRIAFETEDRVILMDQRDLPVESGWSRNYVVGIVAPETVSRISGFLGAPEKPAPQAADLFQVANFHDDTRLAIQMVTNSTPVVTRDFPVDPLRLTAFDLLVVSSESLKELRLPQWKALATWIRAGGKACLIATGPVPELLRPSWRELFNDDPEKPRLTFDEDGRPRLEETPQGRRFNAGCGRMVLLTEPVNVESRDWKIDTLWLWGVRWKVSQAVLTRGHWSFGRVNFVNNQEGFHPLAPVMRPIAELRGPLNSPDVGRVSPVTVMVLLGTCLLLIGPVDYYVLGRLGLRRWTWVFLPCVALGTTWATMRVSQSSLGARDYVRSLSIADVDRWGKTTRVSRLEQHYAGREAVKQRQLTNAYRVDFERPLYGWDGDEGPLGGTQHGGGDALSNPPPVRYSGRVTGSYEMLEPMFQWSPRLFRETTFGSDPRIDDRRVAAIDWRSVEKLSWKTDEDRSRIRDLVRAKIPEATVYIRMGTSTLDCSGGMAGDASRSSIDNMEEQHRSLDQLADVVGRWTSCPLTTVVRGGYRVPPGSRPNGLFGLVRDRSPTAGADLEDLQWIDADDPTEAVLMILVPGEDSVIYRRRLFAQ